MAVRRVLPAIFGAWAGASAWISLGSLALTDASTRARVGALPPVWLLLVLAMAGAAVAAVSRVSAARAWPVALASLLWLPWLPVRVPAAFLIWSGPTEVLVWTVVALGILTGVVRSFSPGGLEPGPPRGLRRSVGSVGAAFCDARVAPWLAALLAVVGSLTAAASVSERVPAGDEPHYLIITQSLLLDGDLRIENNHRRGDYLPYYPFDLGRPDFMRRGTDGQIYSVHLPGVSALILPAFAVGGYLGALTFLVVLSALAGALAWHAGWLLTRDAAAAWVAWAGVAFSAPVFLHTFTIYPDTAGAVLTMLVVWLLVRIESGAGAASTGALVAAGSALAALPWLHSRFSIVAAGLGVVWLLRLVGRADRWRAGAVFLAVPVAGALAWFGYFWAIYGAPDPSLPYNGLSQNQLATLATGLPGLIFDQQFGLVSSAPVFGVALAGLIPLARRASRLTIELLLVAIPYGLTVATYGMWWAGYSSPARFLLVLLWPAVLPLACLWHGAQSGAWRALVLLSIIIGCAGVVARVAVDDGVLLYNARDGYDLLLDWASRTVNLPLAFPSLHRDGAAIAIREGMIWLVLAVALFVALQWAVRRKAPKPPVLWAWSGAAAALALMAGSTLVWARHGDTALTPSTSQLSFLQQWSPSRQPTTLSLRPAALLPQAEVVRRLELTSSTRGPRPDHRSAPTPLLHIPLVPAGQYDVMVRGSSRLQGTLRVCVGRTEQVLETWPLDSSSAGSTGLVLRLPVEVHSVTVEGDREALARIDRLSLRPRLVIRPADRLATGYAKRATRYGRARAFFLDDNAFMEPPGFWTRGEGTTAVIVEAPEASDLAVRLRNGAAANEIDLAAGEWKTAFSLAPGEVRELGLPFVRGTARLLRLRTAAGFSPAEVDPASGDVRKLGVWIEFP